MRIQAVDLAASMSAVVLMADGEVLSEFGSYGISEQLFVRLLCAPFRGYEQPDFLLLEDLPHQVQFRASVKGASRMQGRIAEVMDAMAPSQLSRVRLLQPAVWQRHHDVWRKKPAEVAAKALQYGYTAPDLRDGRFSIPAKGPERTAVMAKLRKQRTDFNDAYLIALWAEQVGADELLRQTQLYTDLGK